jgi:hypothetical protein
VIQSSYCEYGDNLATRFENRPKEQHTLVVTQFFSSEEASELVFLLELSS